MAIPTSTTSLESPAIMLTMWMFRALPASFFTSLVLYPNGLFSLEDPAAHILEPRRGRGGGSSSYYQSCEESYGSGFAQCYTPAVCFNQGGGEKCCEGGCTFLISSALHDDSAVLTWIDRQLPKRSILRLRQLLLLLLGCESLSFLSTCASFS